MTEHSDEGGDAASKECLYCVGKGAEQPQCFTEGNASFLLLQVLEDLCMSVWRLKLVHELGACITFLKSVL